MVGAQPVFPLNGMNRKQKKHCWRMDEPPSVAGARVGEAVVGEEGWAVLWRVPDEELVLHLAGARHIDQT